MSKRFEQYIERDEAEAGLQCGMYVSGVLRVNPKRPSDAFCVTGKSDILIKGKFDRNRAFNGDTIVVEIFPESDWHRTSQEEEKEGFDTRVGGDLSVTVPDEDKDEILLSAVDFQRLSGGSFRGSPELSGSSQIVDIEPPAGTVKTGRVVYVAHCVWQDRVYACSLQPNRMDQGSGPSAISERDTLIRAVPIDKRIPWILIQLNEVVKQALQLPGLLDPQILYPIQVQKWDESGSLPLGRLKGLAYGKVGQPDVEAKVCMAEAGLLGHEEPFSKPVCEEVDRMVSDFWTELEEEASKRIDLRQKRVFTIDPATARDLDDAIHVDVISGEFVEVGVHIADVAHYVKEGSEVDKLARERCTSVYLPHRVFPMLPEGLSNSLCSLTANEPKLTFTAWFRVRRATGEVILESNDPNGPRFAKTVIQSCCRLSYEEVQDVLDGEHIPLTERPTVFGGPKHTWEQLVRDFKLLYNICGKIRKNRFQHGSVRIDKHKMRFKFDDVDMPRSYAFESHSPSHWMIEELMLLANQVVARKICELGGSAVLRRHPPPDAKSFKELSERIRTKLEVTEWDGSSSRGLFESLKLVKARLGVKIGQLIEFLVMKTMKPAQYCTLESGFSHHYALAFDFYTHFTSPIRRYPDILVHRQLQTALELNALELEITPSQTEVSAVEAQCNLCNVMKKKSREVQEKCDVSFFCIYLRNRKEMDLSTSTVMSVTDKCINVYVPKLNKDCPIWFKLTSKVPDSFLANDETKRAELEAIVRGPDSFTFVSESEALVSWSPDVDPVKIAQYDKVAIAILPLDTVPISFATLLLPPHYKVDEES